MLPSDVVSKTRVAAAGAAIADDIITEDENIVSESRAAAATRVRLNMRIPF
ncbi:MAG: hypothetical protein ACR5LF_00180 [Symbiopectobacterium sp.]